ncbi:MAG: hypothetical protein NE330_15550, partial [Lentisphaeraceae bacterium]|nr:hypothetical protein [Lentisphaeraceae bacterium]
VVWDGKVDFDVQDIKLTKTGFKLTFTKPLKSLTAKDFKLVSYHYLYHKSYGSPRKEEKDVKLKQISLSADGLSALIHLEQIEEGKVYDFTLDNVKSKDGDALAAQRMCYTLNKKK